MSPHEFSVLIFHFEDWRHLSWLVFTKKFFTILRFALRSKQKLSRGAHFACMEKKTHNVHSLPYSVILSAALVCLRTQKLLT